MANYSNLAATINAQIKANGNQEITGPVLNAVLTAMVNVLGDGYRLNGVAVPADNPGSPDNRVAYLAAQDGTYTNFGGLTISGEVALLLWDSAWTKETLFSIDTAVTPGSGHLVTSGAVDSALTTLANIIALAYMQLVPAATEGKLAEFDNAGQVRDAGVATTDLATKDGHYPDLFAGFAGNLVDTRSAGTRQGPFAFRQSGGDGVNYMRRILGRTEVWNQLVGPSDTQVTIPSDHLYYAIINGTASVGTSDGTPISVTGGVDIVVDLTLEGLGLTTADQFRALHPLPYYNYNAGVLKNNAATGLETTGFNQWDEEWENGVYSLSTGEKQGNNNYIRCKNLIPVLPNANYYKRAGIGAADFSLVFFDANRNRIGSAQLSVNVEFTTPIGCYYLAFYVNPGSPATYNHDICINISDASRNGIYEPYWKRDIVLGLDNLACHDENDNAVVVNGLDGVGTSQDELVVENGWGTKINKRRGRRAYQAGDESDATLMTDGTNTDYPLATPKVLTLDNPFPALIEVDNLGTEKRLPEDTADNPQAPFECDSNYSVSTANLVRLLNL